MGGYRSAVSVVVMSMFTYFAATATPMGVIPILVSALASAAPTPGGIGAVEAALLAAFSTVEEPAAVIQAVLLYRLVMFWLLILPGWAALTYLRHTDTI